jgi:hypothetical protein
MKTAKTAKATCKRGPYKVERVTRVSIDPKSPSRFVLLGHASFQQMATFQVVTDMVGAPHICTKLIPVMPVCLILCSNSVRAASLT